MSRFRLDLGYRGTDFHGWARQPGLRTVQGVLEEALALITSHSVPTVVAGRTDAGVHARRQVVHLDLDEGTQSRLRGRATRSAAAALVARLRGALRHAGAPDLVIHGAEEVPASFDARFAAHWRSYSYRLADDASFRDPLLEAVSVHRGLLDVPAMRAAAAELVGLHDFLPFCKPRPESTTIRTLYELDISRDADGVIVVRLRADAFCHHMVRAIIGGLIRVGSGQWPVHRPAELVAAAEAGSSDLGPMLVVPPGGLVLEEIGYPAPDQWAAQTAQTQARRSRDELDFL